MESFSRPHLLHAILKNMVYHLTYSKIFICFEKRITSRLLYRRTLTSSLLPLSLNDNEKSKNCSEFLTEHLCCPQYFSETLVTKNTWLPEVPLNRIKEISCIARNFKLSDIKKYPEIFSLHPEVLGERYRILQEIGICNITAGQIMGFKHLMGKTVGAMQIHGLVPTELNIVDHLTSFIDCPQNVKDSIKAAHPQSAILNSDVRSIRKSITCKYLNWKFFSASETKFSSYKRIFKESSFTSLCKTVNILTKKFKLSPSMIISHQFLLYCSPSSLEALHNSFPEFSGQPMQKLLMAVHHIQEIPVNRVLEIKQLLQKYGFTDKQILNSSRIFFMKPRILNSRLSEISRILQQSNVQSHPNVLQAVMYEDYKMLLREDTSIEFFLNSFNNLKQSAKLYKVKLNECADYLASVINGNKFKILHEIQKHPKWQLVTLENTRAVINFFLNNGVSNEQLTNGVIVILYDVEIVAENFKNLSLKSDVQPFSKWKTHPHLLQLLVYYIEKGYFYTDSLSLVNK